MIERCEIGIAGLDEALNGGIPKGNLVLVSGGAGTGKSTLCLHFLITGASKGEKGLYVSTEQGSEELIKQAEEYQMPLRELIATDMIRVLLIDLLREDTLMDKLKKEIQMFAPSRLVVDSLSTFSEFASALDFSREILMRRGGVATRALDQVAPQRISERTMTKRMLGLLINNLKSSNATALLTSELTEKSDNLSSDGISEFLVDGVIVMNFFGIGESEFRTLQIRKMRYTDHEQKSIAYKMISSGIKTISDKEILKL